MIRGKGRTTQKKAPGGRPLSPYYCYLFALALALVGLIMYLKDFLDLPEAMGFYGVAVSIGATGVALASRHTSESSDRKMFDIAQYHFNEKMAILNDHLRYEHLRSEEHT